MPAVASSSILLTTLWLLLPGFVALLIFTALTARPRTSTFERLVEALVFTAIVRPVTFGIEEVALALGRWCSVGTWAPDVEQAWSVAAAIGVALVAARIVKNDSLTRVLRDWGWTNQTTYPSEWFSAFARERRYVVLHLNGERRLYGFPTEWPNEPSDGHFVMTECSWLLDDNEAIPVFRTHKIVVPGSAVELVEFVRTNAEVNATNNEIDVADRKLIRAVKDAKVERKENENGSKGAASPASPDQRGGDPPKGSDAGSADNQAVASAAAPAEEELK